MHIVELQKEPVELYKILKFEGLASSGAEAKLVIDDGQVQVNGQVEIQRRKKIMGGDTITFQQQDYTMKLLTQHTDNNAATNTSHAE